MEQLAIAREGDVERPRADYLEGLILEERGDDPAALLAYRRAGAYLDAGEKAAAALIRMGRPREALTQLQDAPDGDEARYQRALAFVALDDRDGAVRELRKTKEHPRARALLDRLRSMPKSVPPRPARAAAPRPVRFVERGLEAGLDFVLEHSPTHEKHLPETMAGGIAVFDADGDGLPDLFFANGAATPSLHKTDARYSNRLYRNLGGLRFQDITAAAGLQGEGFSIGVAAADYDNDGDVDLFVAGVNRNLIYRNRGDGVFDEVAAEAGIRSDAWAVAGVWLDYDGDGLLDLFVANYVQWSAAQAPVCQDDRSGVRTYCHPKFFPAQPSRLYRNRGDGTFEDASRSAGIAAHPGKAMSAAVADIDADGDLDIFVPNDAIANQLFVNDGRGGFHEAALAAGVAFRTTGGRSPPWGRRSGDVDGDGGRTALHALPARRFRISGMKAAGCLDRTSSSRIGAAAPLRGLGWRWRTSTTTAASTRSRPTRTSWTTSSNSRATLHEQPNALWLGLGDGTFVDASGDAGLAGHAAAHRGLVVADLDMDGRLDAVVSVLGKRPVSAQSVGTGGMPAPAPLSRRREQSRRHRRSPAHRRAFDRERAGLELRLLKPRALAHRAERLRRAGDGGHRVAQRPHADAGGSGAEPAAYGGRTVPLAPVPAKSTPAVRGARFGCLPQPRSASRFRRPVESPSWSTGAPT